MSPGLRPQVRWFEGSYSEYEADRKKRLGGDGTPSRLKFRPMAAMA